MEPMLMTQALGREGANCRKVLCRKSRVGFRHTDLGSGSGKTREQPFVEFELARCQARGDNSQTGG